MDGMQGSAAAEKLWDMIKGIRVAMLTTVDRDGSLRSRPMATSQAEFDGTLWFFTRTDSPKAEEIEEVRTVNLSYAAPDEQDYVSVSGQAEVVRDPERASRLWHPALQVWFPGGPEDPELGLLKVSVTRAEYWDSHAGAMREAERAVAEGREPDLGENRKLDLR